jgi:hypothetical protein
LDLDAGGHVDAHLRAALRDEFAWIDFHDAAVIGGRVRADFDRRARVVAAADLRAHAASEVASLDGLGDPNTLQPWSVKIGEASASALGVGAPWLDLGFGMQTARWGVADGISVTDVVNPYDLEDPTRFDRRLAVPMVLVAAHPGIVRAEVAWLPFFVPAALPTDQVDFLAGAGDVFAVEGQNAADLRELESEIALPDATLANSQVAGRLSLALRRVDLAASWVHGRDSLPQVGGRVRLVGFSTDNDRVDVGIPIVYPTRDQGGLEARGELPWDVGGWAEAAVVLPQRTVATLDAAQLEDLARIGAIDEVPDPIPATVTQDGQPYLRAVVGLDRTFGRVYVNVQWLHGYPTERRGAEVSEYAIVASRIQLADRWVLSLRGLTDGAGWLAGGDVAWLHADAVELSLGATWIDGPEGSALHGFRGLSHVGTGVGVRF